MIDIEFKDIKTDNIDKTYRFTTYFYSKLKNNNKPWHTLQDLEEMITLLAFYGGTETLIQGFLLKDVLQNSDVSLDTITEEFGSRVSNMLCKIVIQKSFTDISEQVMLLKIIEFIHNIKIMRTRKITKEYRNDLLIEITDFINNVRPLISAWKKSTRDKNISLDEAFGHLENNHEEFLEEIRSNL